MKNILTLAIGIIIGVVLTFSYIKSKQQIPVEPSGISANVVNNEQTEKLNQQVKTAQNTSSPTEKNIKNDSSAQATNTSLSKAPNDEGNPLSDDEFHDELLDLMTRNSTLPADIEAKGKAALDALIENQPKELTPIFDSYIKHGGDNPSAMQVASSYKKHLAENKDINWAYDAEAFLTNHFKSQQNSRFLPLRIDCRTTGCELAGMVNMDGIDTTATDGFSISVVMMLGQINRNLGSAPFYADYFTEQGASFSAGTDLSLNPMPHYLFLDRKK